MQCVHGLVIYIVRRRLNPCITKPSLCIHHRYDPSDDETSDPEEPDHSGSETEEANAKQFRFNGKNLGLTYSQCELDMKKLKQAFEQLNKERKLNIDKMVIGQEQHQNGGRHFHIYLHFAVKRDIRDQRFFDITEWENGQPGHRWHPNWKKFPNKGGAVLKWIYYCMKGGNFIKEGFMPNLFLFKDSTNYQKKKADHEAWMRDAEDQALTSPFPFPLPEGTLIDNTYPCGGATVRKRHWLILGKPDAGKTYWINRTFEGKQVFSRGKGLKSPFETGMYKGEPVIIYDDVVPSIAEMIAVTEVYYIRTHVYGSSRYTGNYWPLRQARTIIWVLNPSRLPEWAKPGNENYDIFKTRFNILLHANGTWNQCDDTLPQQPANQGAWFANGVMHDQHGPMN